MQIKFSLSVVAFCFKRLVYFVLWKRYFFSIFKSVTFSFQAINLYRHVGARWHAQMFAFGHDAVGSLQIASLLQFARKASWRFSTVCKYVYYEIIALYTSSSALTRSTTSKILFNIISDFFFFLIPAVYFSPYI